KTYNGIDIDRFLELGHSIYHNPIIEVLEEYRDIFNIAYHNDLLSPVINTTSYNTGTRVPVVEGTEAIKILKYTSEKLDRIYTADSLKNCVKMVQTDEAKEYRQKMDEWLTAFYAQDYDNIQMIEHDIFKVQMAMKFKKAINISGKVCATIGTAATLLTPIVEQAGIVSTIATFVGLPIAFYDPTKKYLWASFGTYHK
ncbi:MAG: hypothetical protein NC177_15600, partial [Ruminococcus flavefaciens]|nr:hypothetical protein [Ruminococcus flavefaciens]